MSQTTYIEKSIDNSTLQDVINETIDTSTFATLTGAQTLTNKDLSSGTNTFPSRLATLTGSQTLTNKIIGSSSTFTAGYNSVVLKASSDSLTATGYQRLRIDSTADLTGYNGLQILNNGSSRTGQNIVAIEIGKNGTGNSGAITYNYDGNNYGSNSMNFVMNGVGDILKITNTNQALFTSGGEGVPAISFYNGSSTGFYYDSGDNKIMTSIGGSAIVNTNTDGLFYNAASQQYTGSLTDTNNDWDGVDFVINVSRVGNTITINWGTTTTAGTSGSTGEATVSGLIPVGYRPMDTFYGTLLIETTGVRALGSILINTSGDITMAGTVNNAVNPWTTGSTQIMSGSVSYLVQ